MDLIHYAGDTVLTGTEIARALLDYARELVRKGSSATVDIPCRHSDGSVGRATILIGPASQLISEAVSTGGDELVDEAVVASLRSQRAVIEGIRALPLVQESATPSLIEDYELLEEEDSA